MNLKERNLKKCYQQYKRWQLKHFSFEIMQKESIHCARLPLVFFTVLYVVP